MLIVRLAWRSLWRNRRRTLITLSSIGLGLALTVWTETFGEGVHHMMINKATRLMAGHVTVEMRGYNESPGTDLFVPSVSKVIEAGGDLRGLERSKTIILAQGVASSGSGSSAISLIGLEPEAEADESPLVKGLVKGRFIQSGDARGVFIGEKLAERLRLDIGKKMVVTTTDSHGELVSDLLRVVGIFRTGSVEMDTDLVQVPLATARRVLNMDADEATQVGFLLSGVEYENEAIDWLRARLGGTGLVVLPWETVMPELASWVSIFGAVSHGTVCLMLVLVGFNILNTILTSVLERGREFATLLAQGTPPRFLRLQVFLETAFLALLGSVFGVVLGGLLALWCSRRGVDCGAFLEDGFSIGGFSADLVIHNYITVPLLLRLGVIVFMGTVLIGFYPTYKSTRVKVADSLRAR